MTEFLFRDDAYRKSTEAEVVAITPEGGIVLDRTVFYATSGGQPGDSGILVRSGNALLTLSTAIHPDGDKARIVHVPAAEQTLPAIGERVRVELDWERRYRLMRMHTALHLLSVVFPFPVTGGQVGEDKGRLDFDMPEVPDDLPALQARLNEMVAADHPASVEWITDAEMDAQAELIKTMKVKPPKGQGRVRLVRIGDVDLQPCGGTHVARTGEIGPLALGKIEKKGKQNRRVSLLFA
ncbi:alanyl-tRNA editing protein [Devosia sp. YIM 151766]|uniref:alanyl-tRNA editing protein n=1 Tax=Devosia sp. YIM 151766 TaxID=3017325 RepID=UPI00255C6F2C|nr:alanyl-tRNA editing protein [Devosia sp. YIM 151766]WIY54094.1 alanyl-tRNA editing protein [Devosia sp. YIM 151766]